jgi:hypothetical protein
LIWQLGQVDCLFPFRTLVHDDEVGGVGQQLILQRERKPRLGIGGFDALRTRHPRQRIGRIDRSEKGCVRRQRLAVAGGHQANRYVARRCSGKSCEDVNRFAAEEAAWRCPYYGQSRQSQSAEVDRYR